MEITFDTIESDYSYAILINGMRVDTAILTPDGYVLDDGSTFSHLNAALADITDCVLA